MLSSLPSLPSALLLLVQQLAAAPPADSAVAPLDSIAPPYASAALRDIVARASERNRVVPRGLQSYRARMRSEMGAIMRRAEGGEAVAQVEQVENEVRWRRPGSYEQRIIGHRTQAMGVNISMLGNLRNAWTVPLLYGNRLTLLFGRPDTSRYSDKQKERIAKRRQQSGPNVAVHPFSRDRDKYYRFAGGDTIAVVRVRGRDIPLVRVVVEPRDSIELPDTPPGGRTDSSWAVILFRGELAVDASRGHLVRMRGYFVDVRGGRPIRRARQGGLGARMMAKVLTAGMQAIAFVELENSEVDERYWLPSYQRIEAQASAAVMGDSKFVFRVVSRFRGYQVNDTTVATAAATAADSAAASADTLAALAGDTLVHTIHRLVWAPPDSVARFGQWSTPIGTEVAAATAEDFNDIAPDVWRPTGRPRLDFRVQRFGDLFRFNRVEGVYTGYGAVLRFRDAAPGVTLAANAGWAWSEGTARGRVALDRLRGGWLLGLRAGRSLDLTNDFRLPMDSGSSLGALFGVDNYDYVDRRSATLVVARHFGERTVGAFGGGGDPGGGSVLRLEAGVGTDRGVQRHVSRGLFRVEEGFRENRGVVEGDYWRTALTAEYHPAVNNDFMRPGLGAVVTYERAAGFGSRPLGWQRVEGRALGRREWGPLIYAARADAGAVFGARDGEPPPPQQLFELGEAQRLPGYGYKEFAGDRAAVARALAMYGLPYWRAPLRFRRLILPAPAPALAFGVQSGWASVGDRESARRALTLLGTDPATGAPLSRPTNGIRASVDFSVRLFGGALGLGVARPIDHPAPWRFVVSGGQML